MGFLSVPGTVRRLWAKKEKKKRKAAFFNHRVCLQSGDIQS